MTHPNEDQFRKGYEAFSRGDMEALRNEHFAPDVIWHQPGKNPVAGDYEGVDEVLGLFGKLFEMTAGTLTLDIHECLANDEHGVMLATVRGEREGKALEDRYAQVVHFRDGKVAESWIHSGDQYAADDFWA